MRDILTGTRIPWSRIAATSLVCGAVALGISFLIPARFQASARASIASERSLGSAARLAGFAAQLGLAGSVPNASDSPELFAAVANGRGVARLALADTICEAARGCETVAAALGAPEGSTRVAMEKRLKRLGKRLSVQVDVKTGLLQASAWADSPEHAEGVLRAVLRGLSQVMIIQRESQARNERLSAESRLKELERRRTAVQDSLTTFYERNRAFENAPRLSFRERQLNRQLDFWQELVTSVAREGETARLDEVRDVPVLTLIESPFASPKRIYPKRRLMLIGGLLLGLVLGLRRDDWRTLRTLVVTGTSRE